MLSRIGTLSVCMATTKALCFPLYPLWRVAFIKTVVGIQIPLYTGVYCDALHRRMGATLWFCYLDWLVMAGVTPRFFRGYPYPYLAEPVTCHWGKGFARSGYGYPRVWGVWGTPRGPGKGSNCVYMIFLFDRCSPFNFDVEDSQSWSQNMHRVALGAVCSHDTRIFAFAFTSQFSRFLRITFNS